MVLAMMVADNINKDGSTSLEMVVAHSDINNGCGGIRRQW